VCSYSPTPPAPAYSCIGPATGQTLNGVPVTGFCTLTIYYCSTTGVASQTAPSGFLNVASSPAGCDYNGVSGAAPSYQENFCKDAQGSCSNCP
jgi:hypothetical protein